MKNDTQQLLQKLFFKIYLFQSIALLAFAALTIMLTDVFKQRMAEQFTEAFRAPLINGDNRQVMLEMPRVISKDFAGVQWKSENGTNDFSVPNDIETKNRLFYARAPIFTYFDEGKTIPAGTLCFYYNRWIYMHWAFSAWILLAVFSLMFGNLEKNRLGREYELLLQLEIKDSLANLAAQVAHDIRSPLAALDALMKDASSVPEEKRAIMRNVSNRIRDIANSLLDRNRHYSTPTQPAAADTGKTEVWLLSSILDPIITEKRLQFRSRPGINIDMQLTQDSYGLFAAVSAAELNRILSNLINNAAEAISETGTITIALLGEANTISIKIRDTGKGIPADIMHRLGKKGETFDKPKGNGLGLHHARTFIENWGGKLEIESEERKGTILTISLPKADPPTWFISELDLPANLPVIAVDDDPTVHQIWKGRFESARVKESGISLTSLSTSQELREWIKNNPEITGHVVYLMDYELVEAEETGLEVAQELGIVKQSVLVTSRYEEDLIVEQCLRLGLKLLPKSLSGFIPIKSAGASNITAQQPNGTCVALVDDDPLVHMTWKTAARQKNISLSTYRTPDEFLAAKMTKDTTIYIDSALGAQLKGEEEAKKLFDNGYKTIILTTGHPPEAFQTMPWIKRIIGKEPPWV